MIHIDQYRFGSAFNVDSSFIYNGTDEYLFDSGTKWNASLTAGNAHTFSFWISHTSTTSPQDYVFGSWYDASNYFLVFLTGTATTIQIRDAGALISLTGGTMPVIPLDGSWQHIAFVKLTGNNTIKVYQNGALQYTSVSTAVQLNANTLNKEINFGRHPLPGIGRYYKGNMCQFTAFNTDETANINTFYNGGTPIDMSSYSPALWYKMDQNDTLNVANGVLDSSGNAVNISGNNMDATNIDTVNFPP